MRLLLPALLLLSAPALAASKGSFTVAETGKSYGELQDAVNAIGGHRGTIVIAPGVYRQCAVQTAGHVTFRAETPGHTIFEAETCEDKAGLVLRGQGSAVEGIVFRGYSVNDGNGAGIRIEKGDLTVSNAMFLDSQEGIIGANQDRQRIAIDRSTFSGLGQCDQSESCAHSIYLGNHGSVSVTNSRFERGQGGHYVKLRVPSVSVTDNSFDDTAGRNTNYTIDLPNGATGLIARNTIVQGKDKENGSAIVTVAVEVKEFPSAGLRIEDNDVRIAPGSASRPAFVADASSERLAIGANRLGAGIKAYERK